MKIIDSFTFYNEIGLLKLRLETLKDSVDYFVISEMSVTHGGLHKGFILEDALRSVDIDLDKVIHVKLDDPPKVNTNIESERWVLENFQRDGILRGLVQIGLYDNDVVMISDCDEIPDPAAIVFACGALQNNDFSIFCQTHRKYFLNAIPNDYALSQCWLGTVAVKWATLIKTTPQSVRRGGDFPRAAFLWTRGRADSSVYVERGGWHLTYFGGPKSVDVKLQSIVEGTRSHDAQHFSVPAISLHNRKKGRTEEIVNWMKSLDIFILKQKIDEPSVLSYLPDQVTRSDPFLWEWLWWYDKVIDG